MSFDEDTAVTPDGAHRWSTTVTDRWDGATGVPNGGVLLAPVVRALLADLGTPDPLSVSALFVRPGRHGPAAVTTAVVRAGRRIGFGTAALTQDGRDVVRVQAACGDLARPDAPALAHEGLSAPDLPPPGDCLDPVDAVPGGRERAASSVLGRLELRVPELPGWVRGRPSGRPSAQLWVRLRDDRDADVVSLVQAVDGLPPVVADLRAWSTTVELTVHVRARPAPGWLRARVDTRHVGAGLHEEDVELWDATGAMVAQSRQLALVLPGAG